MGEGQSKELEQGGGDFAVVDPMADADQESADDPSMLPQFRPLAQGGRVPPLDAEPLAKAVTVVARVQRDAAHRIVERQDVLLRRLRDVHKRSEAGARNAQGTLRRGGHAQDLVGVGRLGEKVLNKTSELCALVRGA